MGPPKGKEVLGRKYKEDTEGLCKYKNYKYNHKSQFITIIKTNYKEAQM